jgi:stress response protein YsnF
MLQYVMAKSNSLSKELKGDSKSIKIPVLEEQLVIEKELLPIDRVVLKKTVDIEEVRKSIDLAEETIHINTVPVNQYISEAPPVVRYEGEKAIYSVVKEVLVIEKRLVLVEEIHITKSLHHKKAEVHETLRSEKIQIEKPAKDQL